MLSFLSPLRFREPAPIQTDTGEFSCPNCRERTTYKQYDLVRRRGFFIFTFHGEVIESYVECDKCERKMSIEDLRGRMAPDTKKLLEAVNAALSKGTAIETITAKLRREGMPESDIRRMVNACVGISKKKCNECSLTYAGAVSKCAECGATI